MPLTAPKKPLSVLPPSQTGQSGEPWEGPHWEDTQAMLGCYVPSVVTCEIIEDEDKASGMIWGAPLGLAMCEVFRLQISPPHQSPSGLRAESPAPPEAIPSCFESQRKCVLGYGLVRDGTGVSLPMVTRVCPVLVRRDGDPSPAGGKWDQVFPAGSSGGAQVGAGGTLPAPGAVLSL